MRSALGREGMLKEIPNFAVGLKCPKCNCPVGGLHKEQFLQYLNNKRLGCIQCGNRFDLFQAIVDCIYENFFFNDAFAFVGAKKTVFNINLSSTPSTTLKFEDHGIPKGSRILHINYTPQGQGAFPLEFHGNSPYRGAPRDSVVLYPAKFGDESGAPTEICVMITWIDGGSLEDVSIKSLVDSIEEYSRDELVTSIVPANTSIEFDVMRYAEEALISVSSKTSTAEFFNSGVSYVPTLKVLLPLIARIKNFPSIPEDVFRALVQLATFRNQIAHTGKTKAPITKKQVATSLAKVDPFVWTT